MLVAKCRALVMTEFSRFLFSPNGVTVDLVPASGVTVFFCLVRETVTSARGLGGVFSSSDSVRSIRWIDSDKVFTSSSERKVLLKIRGTYTLTG